MPASVPEACLLQRTFSITTVGKFSNCKPQCLAFFVFKVIVTINLSKYVNRLKMIQCAKNNDVVKFVNNNFQTWLQASLCSSKGQVTKYCILYAVTLSLSDTDLFYQIKRVV